MSHNLGLILLRVYTTNAMWLYQHRNGQLHLFRSRLEAFKVDLKLAHFSMCHGIYLFVDYVNTLLIF